MRAFDFYLAQFAMSLLWGLWRGEGGQDLAIRLTAVPASVTIFYWIASDIWKRRQDKGPGA